MIFRTLAHRKKHICCMLLWIHCTCGCADVRRYQAFSFLCTFVPGSEKSIERTFAPVKLSFRGTFAPREQKVQELSFHGTFAPQERMFQKLSLPGDTPAIITRYVAWMEIQFNACQTPRSMYPSSTVSQLFEPQVQKLAVFTYHSPHFCFPWRHPCDYHPICSMDGKTIQCLPNPSQHVPIYLQ